MERNNACLSTQVGVPSRGQCERMGGATGKIGGKALYISMNTKHIKNCILICLLFISNFVGRVEAGPAAQAARPIAKHAAERVAADVAKREAAKVTAKAAAKEASERAAAQAAKQGTERVAAQVAKQGTERVAAQAAKQAAKRSGAQIAAENAVKIGVGVGTVVLATGASNSLKEHTQRTEDRKDIWQKEHPGEVMPGEGPTLMGGVVTIMQPAGWALAGFILMLGGGFLMKGRRSGKKTGKKTEDEPTKEE